MSLLFAKHSSRYQLQQQTMFLPAWSLYFIERQYILESMFIQLMIGAIFTRGQAMDCAHYEHCLMYPLQ